MGEIVEAIVLGIVQGLTEFLPVSSSGHLEIMKFLLGDHSSGEESLLMTVVLHFATACATMFVFRADIADLISTIFNKNDGEGRNYLFLILISMLPAAFLGLLLEEKIDLMFQNQLILVGMALFITALLLFFADKAISTDKKVGIWSAFLIGVAQAVAIIPGISRSGATISAAILLKVDREGAARFSFLMVVPLIFGKMAKDIMDGNLIYAQNALALIAGFIAAFVTGILACTLMIKLVRRAQLKYFGWYCLCIGLIAILLGI